MKKINEWNKEYNQLVASEAFRERMKQTMKKENAKKTIWKRCSGMVACVIVLTTVALNTSPGFANTLTDVPVMGSIVKVLTLGRYELKDNGYEADVAVPQLQGLMNKELEKKLNEELKGNADSLFAAFEKDMQDLKKEFGEDTVHMGLDSDYIVKTDTDDILAIDVYVLNTAGSSSTVHTFYTINKKTGDLYTLDGLFKKDSDYVGVLSKYIKGEMERQNKEESGMFWINGETDMGDGFKEIKKDQDFYLNAKGNLVISFDKYEVAAGAQGCPEFVIPAEVVKGIWKDS